MLPAVIRACSQERTGTEKPQELQHYNDSFDVSIKPP
jgi:hypothetical protein